jgi:hypothetical protein
VSDSIWQRLVVPISLPEPDCQRQLYLFNCRRHGRDCPGESAWGGAARPAIIHLWRREQGLLTPEGNPDHINGDLHTLRIARRQFGTGTRVLLDRLLDEAGIAPTQ